MSTRPYLHLFKPLKLSQYQSLKNRFIMGAMHTGLEEERGGMKKLAEFYRLRAMGGVGLIITGGFAPNREGRLSPLAAKLTNGSEVKKHSLLTKAVHEEKGKICLQILHAGRYGYHPFIVAPDSLKSPITPFRPRKMSESSIEETINDFVRCAVLAREAGYDGVEVMGSEGYLINEFLVDHTNGRDDSWGKTYRDKIRFPLEIVRRIREQTGDDFIIIYRISLLDLIPQGQSLEEILTLAQEIEAAGASILNTGIGWHEARVPTIASMVPRGNFSWITRKLKEVVSLPVVASNRINMPETAEAILANGEADLVSMARPFLADENFVNKAKEGKVKEINTCIACNQACLDHTFSNKRSTCLVNPFACYELELKKIPTTKPKKVAVVGGGPAGMACALTLRQRGHDVVLYEKSLELGGQFNLAKKIPGKKEFYETIRYFSHELNRTKVKVHLGVEADVGKLRSENFDEIVVATGVLPRKVNFPGHDHSKIVSYLDVLSGKVTVGNRVVIIGAGGIGFDMADFLLEDESEDQKEQIQDFHLRWGIEQDYRVRGAIVKKKKLTPKRKITMLQRSSKKMGNGLGKTTGWIHRMNLKDHQVEMFTGVVYRKFDEQGLHICLPEKGEKVLKVDHVVVCAGQWPLQTLLQDIEKDKLRFHIIGGAKKSEGLDAKRAIREGVEMALKI